MDTSTVNWLGCCPSWTECWGCQLTSHERHRAMSAGMPKFNSTLTLSSAHISHKGPSDIVHGLPLFAGTSTLLVASLSQRRGLFVASSDEAAQICSTSNLRFSEQGSSTRALRNIEHGLPQISSTSNLRSCGVRSATRGFSGHRAQGCPKLAAHRTLGFASICQRRGAFRVIEFWAARICSTPAFLIAGRSATRAFGH